MQSRLDACSACHQTCLTTAQLSLEKGGTHADPAHLTLLLDCAQICATGADFMLRHSNQHQTTCRACADVCRACAASCETMGDDEMMKRCAEECRRCAERCDTMARMA